MIFGYTLVFRDEPLLNIDNKTGDSVSKHIHIYEKCDLRTQKSFSFMGDSIILSGCKGRYYSDVPFVNADVSFSWALEIKDILLLVWDAEGEEIHYKKGIYYTAERLRFWVYHTFLPLVLELRKIYNIIHVACIEIDDKTVLFSAPSYGGKSTLTNYFLQQGHTLLSDDALAIDKKKDNYYAVPSYPYYRPYRNMEDLGYFTENFANNVKKIHKLYVLEKSPPDSKIKIEKLKGIEKFQVLHASSFINITFMKNERFHFFSDFANFVSVYKIRVPWDLKRLPEVYDAICTHSKQKE